MSVAESKDGLVWYASYGSNFLEARLRCYVYGGKLPSMNDDVPPYPACSDTSPLSGAILLSTPYPVYTARVSSVWDGGVCFLDYLHGSGDGTITSEMTHGSLLRAYRMTKAQFAHVVVWENGGDPRVRLSDEQYKQLTSGAMDLTKHVVAQPSELKVPAAPSKHKLPNPASSPRPNHLTLKQSWYGEMLCLGQIDGVPVLNFSCGADALQKHYNPPSYAYLQVILRGIRETGVPADVAAYYMNCMVERSVRAITQGVYENDEDVWDGGPDLHAVRPTRGKKLKKGKGT